MGDSQLVCPLCCDKTFDSKQSLLEHLAHILSNLFCPACNSKCSSIEDLAEHLNQYDCQNVQTDTVQNIVIYEQTMTVDTIETSEDIKSSDIKALSNVTELTTTETETHYITEHHYECHSDNGEVTKMYAELIGKQLSKPMLQTQEIKLIKEDGESRYMLVADPGCAFDDDSAIVTKQNNDGTISLTTVKGRDIKLETDTLIAPETTDSGNSQGELYSCNACKVSFTSIVDHIQNYHNDQEVVVEEVQSHQQQITTDMTIEYDPLDTDEGSPTSDKPRRVITDTGDIVEEPVVLKADDTEIQQDTIEAIMKHPKLVLDKQGRTYTRRYVQIDKVSEDGTSKLSPVTSEIGHHKVVRKEVQTKAGFTVKMYHCMACNVGVNSLNEFNKHPCKALKHGCLRCPAVFDSSKSLCAHMKAHKLKSDPEVPITYECEVCSTVFPSNKSLKLHKRMHDPVKVRPIEPPVENTDGKEVTGDLYRCEVCDKMIPFDYRAIHDNSHNTDDKMHCSICNKKFSSISYLEMHMNVHNLDKVTVNNQDKSLPYKCLYCNRRFARPHEKVKHERIHTGEKPHSCEICGKSFRVSYCLTLHMRTHTGARPYACPHCGKRFKAHSVYNHHLLTHSEVRAYKCPYCPKAFKTSVQLAGHKNSHTKPFSCQHCNRPFASLYAVRVHTETHARQNNLKFSCALCGASYARAFALKDHVKQVHKQDLDNNDNADNLVDNSSQDEDWMRENTTDTEGLQSLNKELQQDISELGMNTNELIIP